jgi:hypothetical protein
MHCIVTKGLHGAPICWLKGIITILGGLVSVIGLLDDNIFLYGGCTPPLKVARPT